MRRILLSFLSALALIATGVVGAVAVGGTGTVVPPPKIAFLANGIVPADALAAGGIAGQLGAPLFTTRAESLNDDARDGIKAHDPDLVIVLGGPVAINDSVLTALSAATGLVIVPSGTPAAGIVRVAGGDRFATARAVAGLLAAYDPAFLPVDATALGAVDADSLDGLDSTDFALSDQSCDPGDVVTGIAADGTPTCAGPDGGDADTLDGLEGADLAPRVVGVGETLVGVWYFDIQTVDGGDYGIQMDFPTPLSFAPETYVYVPPLSEGQVPGCPGFDHDEPLADPGFFCMYEAVLSSISATGGFAGFNIGIDDLSDDLRRYAASYLFDEPGAASDAFGRGSWAVTPTLPADEPRVAPDGLDTKG